MERVVAGGPDNPEEEAAWDLLMDIEHVLHADIGASTHAVAASLIIEIEGNESSEDVHGLWRGSLVAIRPQLVGRIAQDADRALAEKIEEPCLITAAATRAKPACPSTLWRTLRLSIARLLLWIVKR
jgi:hypothetical protein